MPELAIVLARVRTRWRLRLMLQSIAAGGAVFTLMLILASTSGASRPIALALAAAVALSAAAWLAARSRRLTGVDAAQLVEDATGSLDNLIVTAAELDDRPRPVRAEIRDEIARQVSGLIGQIDPVRIIPLWQPLVVAMVVLVGCGLLASISGERLSSIAPPSLPSVTTEAGMPDFTIRITPPAYTGRKIEVLESPRQVTVVAGTGIEIDAQGNLRRFIATESAGLEIRGKSPEPRFLSLIVVPDAPPSLRIVDPGKDTAVAEPKGRIEINVDGRDDLGLASLALRFTKASGGGENVAFTEGEVPLRIERRNPQHWQAQASFSLDAMGLADGDIVVYRAIARDTNPGGEPVMSEQYLIEIGKNAQIADAGFSLPTEEKKYAISQQMVIYKTEQLIRGRKAGRASSEDWLEQTRFLAMEQRMVRAEVVFLGGGEVQDEVEEAAHAHELAEGRLENTGRAEMLRAINAMSRAEAQLNDGRADEALVFEREALASLERALDRRRYFLRTLPDRSRIDATRRLTGERRDARSWTRDPAVAAPSSTVEGQRQIMQALARGTGHGAELAARIAAVDPASAELQKAAVAVAAATTDSARREAGAAAMRAVTAHALRTLPSSTPVTVPANPLRGKLADELNRKGVRP